MVGKKFWNLDKIIALSAMVVSASALIVSIIQTRIMKEQQQISVKPFIQWRTDVRWNSDSIGVFSIKIKNKGIGPALIKNAIIIFDGEKYPADGVSKVAQKILSEFTTDSILSLREETIDQTVVLPNDVVNLFEVTNPKVAFKLAKAYTFIQSKRRFDIIIDYTDVYGNKFVSSGSSKLVE